MRKQVKWSIALYLLAFCRSQNRELITSCIESNFESKKVVPKPSTPYYEEEVKLEDKLKELEKQQNKISHLEKSTPKDRPKENKNSHGVKNIEDNWRPLKNRLIDLGVFAQDKTVHLFSNELEKSITSSLEKESGNAKDLEIQHLNQQINALKADLK